MTRFTIKLFVGSIITMLLGVGSPVNATITGTDVSVGMKIEIEDETAGIATASGATYASVDLVCPTTGAHVSSMLHINSLSAEEANLNFHILMDGNGIPESGYLGQSDWDDNAAEIAYHADADFDMTCSWSFDYLGPQPFGLNVIYVRQNGNLIAELGNVGEIGHHEGAETLSLLAGNDYTFQAAFMPNVSGGVGSIEGTLTGDISFTFIPEPGTLCLLGLGGLSLLRRRRKNHKKS